MNKETITNLIKLFSYCQSYIPNSKRLDYQDVLQLVHNHINEKDFETILDTIFQSQDLELLSLGHRQPITLLKKVENTIDLVKNQLSPKEKLILIVSLLKIVSKSKVDANLFLDDILYTIGEKFNYSIEEINSIKKIFNSEYPSESDYSDSVLITNESPNYIDLIDGLKVIYSPNMNCKIWVKNIRNINHMLFKIIETSSDFLLPYKMKKNDIIVYNRDIQNILNTGEITLNSLSNKLSIKKEYLPRIEIGSTERSPMVILNSAEGRIEIEGISMIGQAENFYEPIFYWLEKMKNINPKKLDLHINLTFFNTYTSKIILKLMMQVAKFEKHDCETKFYWYNEEDDLEMREAGEHYSSILKRDFLFITLFPTGLTSII